MIPKGARLDDHPTDAELARLEARCFSAPWDAAAYAGLRRNPAVLAWVARDAGGAAAGFICFQQVAAQAEVFRIAVVPERRRGGWGRWLLERVAAGGAGGPATEVTLEVRADNGPAIALYEAVGFSQVGRREAYFQSPPGDALVFRWEPET